AVVVSTLEGQFCCSEIHLRLTNLRGWMLDAADKMPIPVVMAADRVSARRPGNAIRQRQSSPFSGSGGRGRRPRGKERVKGKVDEAAALVQPAFAARLFRFRVQEGVVRVLSRSRTAHRGMQTGCARRRWEVGQRWVKLKLEGAMMAQHGKDGGQGTC